MRRSEWINQKIYKARTYVGNYRTINGVRMLELTGVTSKGDVHRVTFRAHEEAKARGWTRRA